MPRAAVPLITSPIRLPPLPAIRARRRPGVSPQVEQAPAHDACPRLWQRPPADTADWWQEAHQLIQSQGGILVVDDTTLDKPYARKIELVTWHGSGTHHRVVQGINLVSLLWTEGTARIPCDFRGYDKPVGGNTKHEHVRDMVTAAHARGLQPEYVLCDSGYRSLDHLQHLRQWGWAWLTRLKSHRQVHPDRSGHVAIRDLAMLPPGRQVHLRG